MERTLLRSLGILLALLVPQVACDRFEKPTKAECEAAVEHVLELEGGGPTEAAEGKGAAPGGGGGSGGFLDAIAEGVQKAAKSAGGQVAVLRAKMKGEFDRRVAACQADWNLHKTRCVRAAGSQQAAKACSPWL